MTEASEQEREPKLNSFDLMYSTQADETGTSPYDRVFEAVMDIKKSRKQSWKLGAT